MDGWKYIYALNCPPTAKPNQVTGILTIKSSKQILSASCFMSSFTMLLSSTCSVHRKAKSTPWDCIAWSSS